MKRQKDNSLGNITWSLVGKQNVGVKEACRTWYVFIKLCSEHKRNWNLFYRTGANLVIWITWTFSGTYQMKRRNYWQRSCLTHFYNQSLQEWRSLWTNHWHSQGDVPSAKEIIVFSINLCRRLSFFSNEKPDPINRKWKQIK